MRSQVATLQARMTELESNAATRDEAIQEEITRALAHEREGWQRECNGHFTTRDRDKHRFIA